MSSRRSARRAARAARAAVLPAAAAAAAVLPAAAAVLPAAAAVLPAAAAALPAAAAAAVLPAAAAAAAAVLPAAPVIDMVELQPSFELVAPVTWAASPVVPAASPRTDADPWVPVGRRRPAGDAGGEGRQIVPAGFGRGSARHFAAPWAAGGRASSAAPRRPAEVELAGGAPGVPARAPARVFPAKLSMGVILVRINAETRRPEALLVQRRYTYAFAEFIHGRYTASGLSVTRDATVDVESGAETPRPRRGRGACLAIELLDEMTNEERIAVYSLDFGAMWFRVWVGRSDPELQRRKAARFAAVFMRDGGTALRRAVLAARDGGELAWEVPKGRRATPRESDVICAVRELREETGVTKDEYRLVPGARRRTSHRSNGTRYVGVYFIALAGEALAASAGADGRLGGPGRRAFRVRDPAFLGEVGEARFHDVERVRMVDDARGRLGALLAPALRLARAYARGTAGGSVAV